MMKNNDKWYIKAIKGDEIIEKTFDNYDESFKYISELFSKGYFVQSCLEEEKDLIFGKE